MKKVLLIDIDGVVSPLVEVKDEENVVIKDQGQVLAAVPTSLLGFLKHLELLRIDWIWSSTWEGDVKLLEQALGLKPHKASRQGNLVLQCREELPNKRANFEHYLLRSLSIYDIINI